MMSNSSDAGYRDENVLTETIVSHKVLPVPFAKAFATQTDWASRQTLESWYGHHSPFLRTLALMCLFTTLSSLYRITNVAPVVWKLMRSSSLVNVQTKQAKCAESLCSVVQDLRFSCEIDQMGLSAKMLMDSLNGTTSADARTLWWSPVCEEAIGETKQLFTETGKTNLEFENFAFARIHMEGDMEVENPTPFTRAFATIHPSNCSISFAVANLVAAIIVPSNQFSLPKQNTSNKTVDVPLLRVSDYKPEDVVHNVLDHSVCRPAMDNVTSTIVDFVAAVHSNVMGPAFPLIVGTVIFIGTTFLDSLSMLGNMVSLLFTTLFVRLFFRMPKDFCGRYTITYWSTYKMLLLLCTISPSRTGEADDIVFAAMMAMWAYCIYKNHQAATEWVQFGILWYGSSSLMPYLDDGAKALTALDGLGIIRFVAGWIAYFIPGYGWWKLVRVYVFWRSFPRKTKTRQGGEITFEPFDVESHLD